eukprot:15334320-Alexandrium_andersonii.AAC.1
MHVGSGLGSRSVNNNVMRHACPMPGFRIDKLVVHGPGRTSLWGSMRTDGAKRGSWIAWCSGPL